MEKSGGWDIFNSPHLSHVDGGSRWLQAWWMIVNVELPAVSTFTLCESEQVRARFLAGWKSGGQGNFNLSWHIDDEWDLTHPVMLFSLGMSEGFIHEGHWLLKEDRKCQYRDGDFPPCWQKGRVNKECENNTYDFIFIEFHHNKTWLFYLWVMCRIVMFCGGVRLYYITW